MTTQSRSMDMRLPEALRRSTMPQATARAKPTPLSTWFCGRVKTLSAPTRSSWLRTQSQNSEPSITEPRLQTIVESKVRSLLGDRSTHWPMELEKRIMTMYMKIMLPRHDG